MLRQAPPDERTLLQTLRTQETKRKSLIVELAVLNKEITEDYVGFQIPMESLVLELAVLSKEITETKVQYARLQRTMANERLPSLNIPIEVTAEIFREATFGLFDEDESTAREETLRALSHTCHTWRAIVLSLPEVWASFTSTTDRLSDLDRLSIYLSRSKNKPLDLYFYFNPAVKEEASGNVLQTAVIQAILKAAVGHISRWRRFVLRFVFEVETASWPNFIFEIITNQLFPSNLEVIVIDIDPTKDPSLLAFPPLLQDPVQPYFQDGAPRLLHATFDTWSLTAYKPLAHNVTTLHIRHPPNSIRRYSFTEFLDILASSRLVNLSLSGDAFHPPLVGQVHPILAPELKNLRMAYCDIVASNIFAYLRAPKLELLILVRVVLDDTWRFPGSDLSTPSALSNPLPALRSLAFIDCNTTLSCVEHLADITKTVSDLYITHIGEPGPDLFSLMVQTAETSILWPNLSALHCGIPELMDEHCDFGLFLRVVTRRWEMFGQRCVLRLHYKDAKAWRQHDPETWNRLVDGGFYEEWIAPDDTDFVPWPPREATENFVVREKLFLTSYASSLLDTYQTDSSSMSSD